MLTNVIVVSICVWAVVAIATAIVTCREVDISENPVEWLRFFLLAPFMFAVVAVGLTVMLVVLIPIMAFCMVDRVVTSPFRRITTVTDNGLLISQRVGGTDQLLRWTELSKIREIKAYPTPTRIAIQKSGDQIQLPWCDDIDNPLEETCELHGVTYVTWCDDREPDEDGDRNVGDA